MSTGKRTGVCIHEVNSACSCLKTLCLQYSGLERELVKVLSTVETTVDWKMQAWAFLMTHAKGLSPPNSAGQPRMIDSFCPKSTFIFVFCFQTQEQRYNQASGLGSSGLGFQSPYFPQTRTTLTTRKTESRSHRGCTVVSQNAAASFSSLVQE